MAKPEEDCDKSKKVDMFSVWNVEQQRASLAIKAKVALQTACVLKKTTLKGQQSHIERRLYKNTPDNSEMHSLDGVPGLAEECFDVYAGKPPGRRKHLFPRGHIIDNVHPEENIDLRNPEKSEPKVTMAQKKLIFPPDKDDASKCIHEEPVWATSIWKHLLAKCFI